MESLYGNGLDQIMVCLKKSLTNHFRIRNDDDLYGKNKGRRFKCWHFQVDLLLSPQWDDLEDMYRHLKTLTSKKKRKM